MMQFFTGKTLKAVSNCSVFVGEILMDDNFIINITYIITFKAIYFKIAPTYFQLNNPSFVYRSNWQSKLQSQSNFSNVCT